MLLITAAFHATGFSTVSRLAVQAGGDLAVLAPLLWAAFSIDLVAMGLIAAIIARRPAVSHRPILLVLTLPPLAAASLQIAYMGFVPPTAVLLVDVVLLVAAAATIRPADVPQPV